MAFSGKIEDLPIIDLLQYLHAGQKSGTLLLTKENQKAYVYLHKGNIVHSVNPDRTNIGDLLLENHDISPKILTRALERQASKDREKAIGQILVEMKEITQERLKEVVLNQIKQVIYDLATWTQGNFDFEPNDMIPVDDINLNPTTVLPINNINTQHLLLETVRLMDEKDRERGHTPLATDVPSPDPPQAEAASQKGEALEKTGALFYSREVFETRWQVGKKNPILLLTADGIFKNLLREALQDQGLIVATSTSVEECLAKGSQYIDRHVVPVFITDNQLPGMRRSAQGAGAMILERKQHSGWSVPVVVMSESKDSESVWKLYQSGARAVLPKPSREDLNKTDYPIAVKTFSGVIVSLIQQFEAETLPPEEAVNQQLLTTKKAFYQMAKQSRKAPVHEIVKRISESAERAVLFIVHDKDLIVLECFGTTLNGEPIKKALKDIQISLDTVSLLHQYVKDGIPYRGKIRDEFLHQDFYQRIGVPATGNCMILPLSSEGQVVGLLYCDQGNLNKPLPH